MAVSLGALLWGAAVSATGGGSRAARPVDDPRTVLDRVYSAAQAGRGEQRFQQTCSACHTADQFSGEAFAAKWAGQNLEDFMDFVSNAMPENDPGSLTREEYTSVLAYFLRLGGYPEGVTDLPADKDTLVTIGIVSRPR